MRVCTSLALLIAATGAACSSNSSPNPANPDARTVDADTAPSVRTVTCPPGSMPMVTTSDGTMMFSPASTTISAHGIVKFVTSSIHNVAPNPAKASDPNLSVNFNTTACLEFDKPGTFNFYCSVHHFEGMIVVQ
jgi:plastocyanin